MKKILKIAGIAVLAIAAILGISIFAMSKPLPEGKQGPEAEALADKILAAVDHSAWDTTCLIQWQFPGGHAYTWDKERGFCEVKWGKKRVLLNTSTLKGIAYKNGEQVSGKQADKLLDRAWFFFANDSYWLAAPFKIKDGGTERRIVELENGEKGLLVTYGSGGVTPGDSYLWKVDQEGLPLSFSMWVKIIPVGGVSFDFSGWQELASGAMISSTHPGDLLTPTLTEIKSAQAFEGLGLKEDLFEELITLQ